MSKTTLYQNRQTDVIRLITSKTVNLIVGPRRKSYSVQKDLLCFLSEFFNKAFNGAFQEAQQDEIYLKDENPTAIELFIGWLYRGAGALTTTDKCLATLLELYLTADKWCMPALQNAVIDSTLAWFESHPDKGLKALVLLIKDYYSFFEEKSGDRYGNLMIYYTVELCLNRSGDIDDFLRIIRSNRAFAEEVATLQMLIMDAGRQNLEAMDDLKQCIMSHENI